MQLSDVKALVTGGGTGIGLETARRIIDAGGQAVICGRRPDVLADAAKSIGATAIAADVSHEDQVDELVRGSQEALGGLNVLVNNAAFAYSAPLLDLDTERFRNVYETNVIGAMMVARACARVFVEQTSGTIINVGSTAAHKGYPGGSAYASSKFALSGLTECWRAELRPHGIRVMQMDPSEVQTPFGGRDMSQLNDTKLIADDIAHMIVAMIALPDRGFVTNTMVWATNPK